MRVLHSAYMLGHIPGIVSQMMQEKRVAHEIGLDWATKIYANGDENDALFVKHGNKPKRKLKHRIAYYQWLSDVCRNYDVLLLRYIAADPLQYLFLKRHQVTTYTVHHTKEVDEVLTARSGYGFLKALVEIWCGRLALKNCSGIVGVTSEIAEWQHCRAGFPKVPVFTYPNAAPDIAAVASDARRTPHEVLFVASNLDAPWHGLDLLLKSISSCGRSFVLHVVGTASEKLARMLKSDQRIRYHGTMAATEISLVAARCTVGISGLAQNRRGLQQACTLKVREYLALGLPAYSTYEEMFPDNFPYYRNGTPNMLSILSFADEVSSVSREEVRAAAWPYIDKRRILSGLYSCLLNGANQSGPVALTKT